MLVPIKNCEKRLPRRNCFLWKVLSRISNYFFMAPSDFLLTNLALQNKSWASGISSLFWDCQYKLVQPFKLLYGRNLKDQCDYIYSLLLTFWEKQNICKVYFDSFITLIYKNYQWKKRVFPKLLLLSFLILMPNIEISNINAFTIIFRNIIIKYKVENAIF